MLSSNLGWGWALLAVVSVCRYQFLGHEHHWAVSEDNQMLATIFFIVILRNYHSEMPGLPQGQNPKSSLKWSSRELSFWSWEDQVSLWVLNLVFSLFCYWFGLSFRWPAQTPLSPFSFSSPSCWEDWVFAWALNCLEEIASAIFFLINI